MKRNAIRKNILLKIHKKRIYIRNLQFLLKRITSSKFYKIARLLDKDYIFVDKQSKRYHQNLTDELKELNRLQKDLEEQFCKITDSKKFKYWQAYNALKKNPKKAFLALRILLTQGPIGLARKMNQISERAQRIIEINRQYQEWLQKNLLAKTELDEQRLIQKKFHYRPKISIITPVYNEELWLGSCIESVLNQTYDHWELCLADDCSTKPQVKEILNKYSLKNSKIKVVFRAKNGHISRCSNTALKLATGEYIVLLDNDDILAPDALFEIVKFLNEKPEADFIYSDEDKIDFENMHFDPHFKPDWSPETLLSSNYITHMVAIRKALIDKIRGFRIGYEGSQDYDLFLRVSGLTKKIYHLPKILYHWRTTETSTASQNLNLKHYAYQNAVAAIQDALIRRNLKGSVKKIFGPGLYQTTLRKNSKKDIDLFLCASKNYYQTISYFLKDQNINKIYVWGRIKRKYSGSRVKYLSGQRLGEAVNECISQSHGKYILFFDSSYRIIKKGWLENLTAYLTIDDLAMVSSKIIKKDEEVIQTGIVIGKENNILKPIPAFYGYREGGYFTFNYSRMLKDYSACSLLGAVIKRETLDRLGEIDSRLQSWQGIGLYLGAKIAEKKHRVASCPYFPLIGKGLPDNEDRCFRVDWPIVKPLWEKIIKDHDPFYNPNLTITDTDFSLDI